MKYLYIILIIIGSLIILHLGFSLIIFNYSFYMSKRRRLKFDKESKAENNNDLYQETNAWKEKQPSEHIYLQSFDNIKLHAELLENQNNPIGTIIIFHGYFGSNYGRTPAICHDFLESNNYNILLVDQRAFHLSEGHYTTLGYKEKDDVKTWVDYISNRYPNLPIVIYGFSFGAATVLLSCYQELTNVKLIIADSGYTDAYSMFKLKLSKVLKFDSKLLVNTVNLYARIFGHFNLKKTSVKESLSTNTTMPILYIHGTCDDYVPCGDSSINADHTKTLNHLEIFPGALHVRSYNKDPKRYIEVLNKYINTYIK